MSDPDLTGMDPQARRFLAMVAVGAAGATAYASIEQRRRSFEHLMRFSRPPAEAIDTQDHTIPTRRARIALRAYALPNAPPLLPGLVYFHGGGLVAGSVETHDAICRWLVLEAQCRVVSVDYRLAPEHPFPAAVVDALYATRWISRHRATLGIEELAVGGDSGGATLAAIACQVLHRSIEIKAQVLLCPVLDCSGVHASRRTFADGFMLDAATMARDLELYAPTRPLEDPRLSPLRATSLADMPATLIHTAGFDPLRDEGAAYATRLRDAGVAVEHVCHETLIHHFYGLAGAIPTAHAALVAIAAGLKRVLA